VPEGFTPCATPGCVALAPAGAPLCVFHAAYYRRASGDVALVCYSCGRPIRIGAQWVVRTEGAYHARRACLSNPAPNVNGRPDGPIVLPPHTFRRFKVDAVASV
jgi:hypothetical protein